MQFNRGRLRVIGYLSQQSIAESVDYLTCSSSECLEDAAKAEFWTSATKRISSMSVEVLKDDHVDKKVKINMLVLLAPQRMKIFQDVEKEYKVR